MILYFGVGGSALKTHFINHKNMLYCPKGTPSMFIPVHKAILVLLIDPY